ncbi:MAG: HAD family hydrolase [Sporocytophaga sp.]|uniref:D-glycero-alpha-D-manno-heptose-1,7-bisphosphate 7-phosphatase n=1 Tax=Sporocytophaga sp. TaxID=2231183 RepID=UPI001B1F2CC9|nr:HAD family hydrolase [Sporocytophaga sp.]MBO9700518.1 HAD family hydrolase [Sporocytophaga sp.]
MGAKCIFLDRDGVINVDKVDYTYTLEDFKIIPGVIEALKAFKKAGYLLVVITNQSGIAKGIYGHEDVKICHDFFQEKCGNLIDRYYYSPYHQTISESISRKPDSLMFEKAIAKFDIDIKSSWMIGDKNRDLVPAKKLGIKTVLVGHEEPNPVEVNIKADDLKNASELILQA